MAEERSAGIILVSQKKTFLLLHYEEGHWSFPKGHLEQGEGDAAAAKRELKEETGIGPDSVEFVPGFKQEISYWYTRGEKYGEAVPKRSHKTVAFFLAKAPSELSVTVSHEHIGYAWLPAQAALKQLTYENDRNVLQKAAQVA